jgi:hypothetical protein
MRAMIQINRTSKEPSPRPPSRELISDQTPGSNEHLNFPRLSRNPKIKRGLSPLLLQEQGQKEKGYLSMHQTKQIAKQVGFFFTKKKEILPLESPHHGDLFETPRFGEQLALSVDFMKSHILTGSATCQTRETKPYPSESAASYLDSKDYHNLTFADRVERSFVNMLPKEKKETRDDPTMTHLPRRRLILPSLDHFREKSASKTLPESRLSKSFDIRPQSDGRSAPKFVNRRIDTNPSMPSGKLIKIRRPPAASDSLIKRLPDGLPLQTKNQELVFLGKNEVKGPLKPSPTFGCINPVLVETGTQSSNNCVLGYSSPSDSFKKRPGNSPPLYSSTVQANK